MTIYILHGPDFFFIKNKTNQLIKSADIDAFNQSVYDLDEVDLDTALQDALTIPFMAEQKCVVIKNAHFFADAKAKAQMAESTHFKFINSSSESPTLLIFQVPHATLLKNKEMKAFYEHAEIISAPSKKPQDLNAWVERQLSKAQLSLSPDGKKLLMERITHDPETAYHELQKLLLYAAGKTHVDDETLDRLITIQMEDNVFDIMNLLFANEKEAAFKRISLMLAAKEDPLRILSAFINKFREMVLTQSLMAEGMDQDAIQQYLNVKSGRAYYMMKNARQYPRAHVEKSLKQLEMYDLKIKTGLMDKTLALELFVLGV